MLNGSVFKKIVGIVFCVWFVTACTSLHFERNEQSFNPPLPYYGPVKTAFVLGGGGAKGLAHVGVMEELLKADIKPDLIVGCSAGAIVGGLYADSLDIDEVRETLIHKRREDVVNVSVVHLPFGLSNGLLMKNFLKDHMAARRFEDLKIPFIAVATNLEFGDLTAFGTGPVIDPILASAAFPGVFLPVKIEHQYFVDGGVADPVPANIARALGAEYIIAIDIGGDLTDELPNHVFGVLKRSLEISYMHQTRFATKGADWVIRVPFKDVGTFDDGLNEYIYQKGREAGRDAVKGLKINDKR